MLERECKLYLDGYEIRFTIEFEESEIENMNDEEREEYICQIAWEYARDQMQIIVDK